MQSASNDHYCGAILEDIQSKLELLAEVVSGMAVRLENIDVRLRRVEEKVEVIPAFIEVAKAHSIELSVYGTRITKLETA